MTLYLLFLNISRALFISDSQITELFGETEEFGKERYVVVNDWVLALAEL